MINKKDEIKYVLLMNHIHSIIILHYGHLGSGCYDVTCYFIFVKH